jgi:hypothetical protein
MQKTHEAASPPHVISGLNIIFANLRDPGPAEPVQHHCRYQAWPIGAVEKSLRPVKKQDHWVTACILGSGLSFCMFAHASPLVRSSKIKHLTTCIN